MGKIGKPHTIKQELLLSRRVEEMIHVGDIKLALATNRNNFCSVEVDVRHCVACSYRFSNHVSTAFPIMYLEP